MNCIRQTRCLFLLACCWLLGTGSVWAQLDRVYDNTGTATSGTVMQTSAQGIQFKKGSNTQTIAAGDIQKIMYEGDPAPLTKGREFALDGQYEQALEELQKIDIASLKRDVIQADVAFYLALSQTKLALAGKGKREEAENITMAFASKYRDSWHFFESAKLLGDLALAYGEYDKATKFYSALKSAPTVESKIEAVYLQGLVHLKKNETEAALAEFEKVIGLKAESAAAVRLQTLSKAGKAMALAASGDSQSAEGLELVKTLIAELNPVDVELAARIYNAQGSCHEASGDAEGAIIAYLHTHLMFSSQADAHAEALQKLVALWPQVGKPERAAEARQELQQRYPGFQQ